MNKAILVDHGLWFTWHMSRRRARIDIRMSNTESRVTLFIGAARVCYSGWRTTPEQIHLILSPYFLQIQGTSSLSFLGTMVYWLLALYNVKGTICSTLNYIFFFFHLNLQIPINDIFIIWNWSFVLRNRSTFY